MQEAAGRGDLWAKLAEVLRTHAPQVEALADQAAQLTGSDDAPAMDGYLELLGALGQLRQSLFLAFGGQPSDGSNLITQLRTGAPSAEAGAVSAVLDLAHAPLQDETDWRLVRCGEAAEHLRRAAYCWGRGELHPDLEL